MSYILDALKRADADRARGAVPGLHTPHSALPATGLVPRRSAAALPWLLGATAFALVGGAGWWFGAAGRTESPAVSTADRAAAQAPAPAQAASAPGMQSPPATPVPVPVQMAAAPAEASPAPATAVQQPVSATATHAAAVSPSRAETDRGRDSAKNASARVPTAAELPPDIRRQLPSFSHNGSSYSSNPAMRMLIVQSQVYREGDRLGPDWTLEQIGPKAAVLNFRGQRYQVPL